MYLCNGTTLESGVEQPQGLNWVACSWRPGQAVAQRARIVLMTADGTLPGAIASEPGVPSQRYVSGKGFRVNRSTLVNTHRLAPLVS